MQRATDRVARAVLLLVVIATAVATSPAVVGARPAGRAPDAGPPHPATGRGTVPDDIADRYLVHRPSVGPVTVVDITDESLDRRLLAATLQGVVNRTQARIYLLGARPYAEDAYWLDSYDQRGLIHVQATVGLDQALASFAGELDGYVLGSYAEPWTINTATTVAGAEGAVVATPATVGDLTKLGLTQLADHRGRWPDAITAYEQVAKTYRAKLDYPGVAIEKPDANQPRDLFVQQGILTVFTRPPQADFDRVYKIIERYPADHPVYGYVSDTGDEETTALVRLARTGRSLVPTDTTDNLSFHIAVGGPTRVLPPKAASSKVAPCTSDTVNVVISMSDGDNLVIPEAYYPRADRWSSPRRGELPVGWGISPVTSVLMPGVWDLYAGTAAPGDELVDLMGMGYAIPSLMPDGRSFLEGNDRLRAVLGLDTHWSLDALLSKPDATAWKAVGEAAVATGTRPAGILLNYEDAWGAPPWFRAPDGTPVLSARRSSYDDGPADLADLIRDLVALPAAKRPLVNFFPATVWNASYDALADEMAPLRAAGVRFLTPRDGFACLPAPPATTTTTSSGGPGSSTTVTHAVDPADGVPAAGGAVAVAAEPTFTG